MSSCSSIWSSWWELEGGQTKWIWWFSVLQWACTARSTMSRWSGCSSTCMDQAWALLFEKSGGNLMTSLTGRPPFPLWLSRSAHIRCLCGKRRTAVEKEHPVTIHIGLCWSRAGMRVLSWGGFSPDRWDRAGMQPSDLERKRRLETNYPGFFLCLVGRPVSALPVFADRLGEVIKGKVVVHKHVDNIQSTSLPVWPM